MLQYCVPLAPEFLPFNDTKPFHHVCVQPTTTQTTTTQSNYTRMSYYRNPPSPEYNMAQPRHYNCSTIPHFSSCIPTAQPAAQSPPVPSFFPVPPPLSPRNANTSSLSSPRSPRSDKEPVLLTRCATSLASNSGGESYAPYTLATLYRNKIFVGSLTRFIKAGDLVEFFQKFGVVTEAKVVVDDTGSSRGYGFVTFADVKSVNQILNAGSIFICGQRVAVASAIRKKHPDDM